MATSICVLICDLYLWLLYNARIVGRLSIMTLIGLVSRVFVFVGGAESWLLGYILYYVIFSTLLVYLIVKKFFPYTSHSEMNNALESTYMTTKWVNIASYPEFILLVSTIGLVLTVGGFVAFRLAEIENVAYRFAKTVNHGVHDVSYIEMCVCAISIVISIGCFLSTYRSFFRRQQHMRSRVSLFLIHRTVDIYYICCLASYVCIVLWCLLIYWYNKEKRLVVIGTLAPLIFVAFSNGYLYFVKNDGNYLEDVGKINRVVRKHNRELFKT